MLKNRKRRSYRYDIQPHQPRYAVVVDNTVYYMYTVWNEFLYGIDYGTSDIGWAVNGCFGKFDDLCDNISPETYRRNTKTGEWSLW